MTKMQWGDARTALAMRDVIRGLAKKVVDKERPRPRYGTLVANNFDGTCSVLFPGDATPVTCFAGMVQPISPGVRVRVERVGNDRYISDAFGGTQATVPVLSGLQVEAGLSVTGGIFADSLQAAATPSIAQVLASFPTTATGYPAGAWDDLTTGQWPYSTVVVPPSGTILTIVQVRGANNNTSTSYLYVATRAVNQAAVTQWSPGFGNSSAYILSQGAGATSLMQTVGIRWTNGLTPGDVLTVIPVFQYSSGTPSNTSAAAGPYVTQGQVTNIPLP